MIVLVTDYLYIKAEKVHSITVQERVTEHTRYISKADTLSKNGRAPTMGGTLAKSEDTDKDPSYKDYRTTYTVNIQYIPINYTNQDAYMNTEIKIHSEQECRLVMRSLISQLKKQDPDLLDRIFEEELFKEKKDDRRAKKVSGAGQKKRRNQKVP